MTSFLFAGLGVVLITVTLPVTSELAVLTLASLLPRRRAHRAKQITSVADLNLTVIVPAHNEELLIARSVRSLRASASESATRIMVIAHNCSDQTGEQAAGAGAEVLVYDDPNARGKGFALRYGLERAFSTGADAALVIDADSVVSENLIAAVRQALAQGASVAQCRYEMESANPATKTNLAALAFRGFNLIRPKGRERLGLSSGILGNGFAIKKSVFLETPYNAFSIVEDLEFHLHLVMAGQRVQFLEQARVSADFPISAAGETTQRSRWEGGRFLAARQWIGPLARQVLRGRLRLLEPLLDLASLPLAYAAFALFLALLLPIGWLRIYAAMAFTVIGLHVVAAAWQGDEFWSEMRLFCMVPAYIFWKLRIIPSLLRYSGAGAGWVRTERESAVRKL